MPAGRGGRAMLEVWQDAGREMAYGLQHYHEASGKWREGAILSLWFHFGFVQGRQRRKTAQEPCEALLGFYVASEGGTASLILLLPHSASHAGQGMLPTVPKNPDSPASGGLKEEGAWGPCRGCPQPPLKPRALRSSPSSGEQARPMK